MSKSELRFFGKAPDASEAVALIEHAQGKGTGFLAAPNLLVTNHHVIDSARSEELRILFPQQTDSLKVEKVLHLMSLTQLLHLTGVQLMVENLLL